MFRRVDLLTKLQDDSSFIYYANVITDQPSYRGLKVYFIEITISVGAKKDSRIRPG